MLLRNLTTVHCAAAALAGMVLALSCVHADAQLIAADSFNADSYNDPFFPGTQRLNLTGPEGDGNGVVDPGWVDDGDGDPSAWVAGSGNLQWDAGSPGIESLKNSVVTYDDDSTGKGRFLSVSAPAPVTDFRRAFRVMDDYTPVDTYYMSALLNPGSAFTSATSKREHALVGFTSAGWSEAGVTNGTLDEGIPYGLTFGFHGEGADSNPAAADQVDLVVRARQSGSGPEDFPLQDTVLLAGTSENPLDNITFLVMLKLEVNSGENGEDRVTYWVNPGDVSSEAAATNSTEATGSFDTFAMDTNNRIDRLTVFASSYETRSMFFDELRLATTFEALRGELATTGLIGDYNNDSIVNAADYTVWRNNLGSAGDVLLNRDPANTGNVGADDYASWRTNFGNADGLGSAVGVVPEPTSVLLMFVGLIAVSLRTRSSKR